MTSVRRLPKKEYIAFEELISSTADGRAFLRQRDAQARVVALESVRRMMKQLMIMPQNSPGADVPVSVHVRILRKELLEISAHIQQTRSEIAALRPNQEGDSRIFLPPASSMRLFRRPNARPTTSSTAPSASRQPP